MECPKCGTPLTFTVVASCPECGWICTDLSWILEKICPEGVLE